MSDPTNLTATEAAALIKQRKLTSVALVEACLDRIEERDIQTGAWAYIDADHALAQARLADRTDPIGHLHGVPVGLKDIIDTKDMPTEYGSMIYRGHRPAADATCVSLLRSAGAVILGKTVTTEFGFRRPGKTTNPHNPLHTPGGSSSGSAAAVADSTVPLAIGAQTAGSIIRPAAYCGVAGFKPSYGVTSYSGIRRLAESFDTLGWMARSVDDLALCRKVLCGESRPLRTWERGAKPRLAFCRTPYWDEADSRSQSLLEETAVLCGESVDTIDLGVDGARLLDANWIVTKFEAARLFHADHLQYPRAVSKAVSAIVAEGFSIDITRYEASLRELADIRRSMNQALEPYDAIITPSAPGEAAASLMDTGPFTFNFLWTVAHLPCLTLPAGVGDRGLPLGVQFVGSRYRDHDVVSAAGWMATEVLPRLA